MRHLTASQKIAILERKVAKLEEDMVINNIPLVLEKLNVKNSGVDDIFNKVSPIQVLKGYNKVKNTLELDLAIAEVKKKAGGSLNSQLKYLVLIYKAGLNGSRKQAAIFSGSDLDLFLTGFFFGEIIIGLACLAFILILSATDKVFHSIFGRDILMPIKNSVGKILSFLFS